MKIAQWVHRPFRTEFLRLRFPDTTCLANFQLCLRHEQMPNKNVLSRVILSVTPPTVFIKAPVFLSLSKAAKAITCIRVAERLRKLARHIVSGTHPTKTSVPKGRRKSTPPSIHPMIPSELGPVHSTP
jgi:hypothetical protein